MRDLARRHGPLILLRLGGLPVVVASSADAAREVMVSRDVDFATRHMSRMVRLSIAQGAEGIIFAPYGDEWRQMRKICTVELLSARRVRSFRPVREEEAGRLLRAVAASPGTAVNLSELLWAYAADSSVRAIVGSRFKDRDAFMEILQRGLKLFAGMSLPDLYPSSRLAMLVSRTPGRMRQHRQQIAAFMDAVVQEHQENRAAAGEEEDLLDVLLRIQQEGGLQFPLTTANIKSAVGVSSSSSSP
jgi:cytochrome P450